MGNQLASETERKPMLIQTRDDATMVRAALVPAWTSYWHANEGYTTTPSTNMCCVTAWMIRTVDPNWQVVHGQVAGACHAWCERSDGTVLDITGDQFGYPAVVWGDLPLGYVACGPAVDECCPAAWRLIAQPDS